MAKNYLLITFALITVLFQVACNDDEPKIEPEIPNEKEFITNLFYGLTNPAGDTMILLTYSDFDGDGGDEPIIFGGTLNANQTYTGTMLLSDQSFEPGKDITTEVKLEDEEHQFFFDSDKSDVVISYTDEDSDGNPLGLETTFETGAAGLGNITVTLRHQPNKSAANVANGDITNAGGETDIAVTFPIEIQ